MLDTKHILLIGNPNVGKSTLFNALTGMHQHTGNWTGKTVGSAKGSFESERRKYYIYDLPGTYSLTARSEEERITTECLQNSKYDAVIVVCDATNLEHGINLTLQILGITERVVVCVNLIDEANKRGLEINNESLSKCLGTKTVCLTARKKKQVKKLITALDEYFDSENKESGRKLTTETASERINKAEMIASACINSIQNVNCRTDKYDEILTGKLLGLPILCALFIFIFWLTIRGSNYPSALLSDFFGFLSEKFRSFLNGIGVNKSAVSLFVDGIWGMTARVVSVMLPPMAIFFPLFTILEDLGYLTRIAFILDRPFEKCKACGKQALTMCMGFGCNACGVTGARIIDSTREKLLAILTNSFVPCNGKFPTIIALITIFFVGSGSNDVTAALILGFTVALGVAATFIATKLLSSTLLKGSPSSYILELPPFRKPQFCKIAIRSLLDRTLFVLGRAIISAAPAGLLIWLLANVQINEVSVLNGIANTLDPIAEIFGLDGVILTAFILGLPANETVMPIIIMAYMSLGTPVDNFSLSELKLLLAENGWTFTTAICTLIFMLFHWPCATTLLTIKKETGSAKWTAVSALLPTAFGLMLCFIVATVSKLFG